MIYNQDDEFNFRVTQAGKKIWMDPTLKTKYYARSNYKKLFKQYFNYGLYKVRGFQKRGRIFSIRHLIPSLFLGGLLFSYLMIPFIFISFCVLHISYGTGFICGLLKFSNKWSDKELKDFHFNKENFNENKIC